MMDEVINFLQTTGNATFEYFWFPLLLWTAIAIPVIVLLRRIDAIPPVYQHHSRAALMLTLPVAMVSSYLVEIIEQAVTSAETTTKFIVIQNPITIWAIRSEAAIRTSFSEPMF